MSLRSTDQVTLYFDGDALYADMLADIAAATVAIRMESYIFASDAVGRRFVDALAERAANGVVVRLHVDQVGSFGAIDEDAERVLIAAGVRFRRWRRWRWHRFWRIQRRNHRKLLVVDERAAYLGGFNIHAESSRAAMGDAAWRDAHVRLTGPVVDEAARLFDAYAAHRYYRAEERDGILLVPNRGIRGRWLLHRLLTRRFAAARARIEVTTPYFVPDWPTRRALIQAARRGVSVSVMLPARSDVPIAAWAARAVYASLLRAGIEILEYQPRMLHAKTIVIDTDWATLGTANLDHRSFFINDELNAVFRDRAVVAALAARFETDRAVCTRVEPDRWSLRPWWSWLGESVAWLARRWL
jgi:cardiolipin synthase